MAEAKVVIDITGTETPRTRTGKTREQISAEAAEKKARSEAEKAERKKKRDDESAARQAKQASDAEKRDADRMFKWQLGLKYRSWAAEEKATLKQQKLEQDALSAREAAFDRVLRTAAGSVGLGGVYDAFKAVRNVAVSQERVNQAFGYVNPGPGAASPLGQVSQFLGGLGRATQPSQEVAQPTVSPTSAASSAVDTAAQAASAAQNVANASQTAQNASTAVNASQQAATASNAATAGLGASGASAALGGASTATATTAAMGGAGGAGGGGGAAAAAAAAGGAAAGGGGAMATIAAVALPVAAGLAAIAAATIAYISVFRTLQATTQEATDRLKAFNGQIAAAEAMRDVNRMMQEFRQAQILAEPMATASEAQQDLDTAYIELQTEVLRAILPIVTEMKKDVTELIQLATGVAQLVNDSRVIEGLVATKQIYEYLTRYNPAANPWWWYNIIRDAMEDSKDKPEPLKEMNEEIAAFMGVDMKFYTDEKLVDRLPIYRGKPPGG